MVENTELAAALPHILLPNEGLLLPRGASALDLEQRFVDEMDRSLNECAPGFSWSPQSNSCVPDIVQRTARCPYGYVMNVRLNECRRAKYELKPERGTIKRWWDSVFNKNTAGGSGSVASATPKPGSAADYATHTPPQRPPTSSPEAWFGYGYNFGRHEPHW
ncbi:uncharacterized protein LOC6580510 [Drosophila mojavensis]|uniref:Uncharacterized protein n=1 Tax=Drosophila mojavensis TaxID=7230 RepID=B4KQE0_DROMO|nr:uncharacterized protein LOC6580510 [Drosophila mojavensis]EDW10280.1 uncharacterized protein Dmoj_GI18618 [Drosophila mojavensis]